MSNHTKARVTTVVSAVALTALALSGCAANGGSSDSASSHKLEITSWWTSGSEKAALDVLIAADEKADPGVKIDNAAVSGGGGANAQQALAARLAANDPPATWQLHPDAQLRNYVAGNQVADISALWKQNGWASQLPEAVAKVQQVDGKYYTVPVGVHRGNVVWTNLKVLAKAGVKIDSSTTSIDDLISSLQKVKASTGQPSVCLGDKDIFASSELLESLIMARLGSAKYEQLIKGDYSFDSAEVRQALTDYKSFLSLANPDHTSLTWDQASANLAAGKCAVNVMGDWAYGEMVNGGAKPGIDFGWTTFPSSQDIFDYVGDGFSIPAKNNPALKSSQIWLKTLMDPKVQTEFAAKKGSIPALTTADVSSLSEYQQGSAKSFKNGAVVSSLAQGQATPSEFTQTFADAVTTLNGDGNIDAFVATMKSAQASQLKK